MQLDVEVKPIGDSDGRRAREGCLYVERSGANPRRLFTRARIVMTRQGVALSSLAAGLVLIGLHAANTLTVPDWAIILRVTDVRASSPTATGFAALGWMNVYSESNFASLRDLFFFLHNLQVPIPPLLAAGEVISYLSFGTVKPVTVGLYQGSLIGAFVLALVLCRRRMLPLLLCFGLSVTFLTNGVELHRINPQVYDVVCPFLLLVFIVTLDLFPSATRMRTRRTLGALSGLSLSMAELTRPFMVYLLPFLILSAIGVMRGKRCLVYFFLPLIVLSGSWHAHLAIRYHRLAWTNHAGFNLVRAWPMVKVPPLVPEHAAPSFPGGPRQSLNTEEHSENGRRLTRAVVDYVVAHPPEAALHVLELMFNLVFAKPSYYEFISKSEVNYPLYWGLVRACAAWWLLNLVALVASVVRAHSRGLVVSGWATSAGALLIATTGLIFFLSVGEQGEGIRFLMSILPLFAALPMCRPWTLPLFSTGWSGARRSMEKSATAR